MSKKVKILKTTMADRRLVKNGDVVEVSDRDAAILIQLGKAVIHHGKGGEKSGDEPKDPGKGGEK